MRLITTVLASLTALALAAAPAALSAPERDRRADRGADRPSGQEVAPLVIGHRGASGYRPEHTLASYELAARMGADCIEPDIVSTSDGVLVARHENEISGTTDIADRPEFADRYTTKVIDGVSISGWFTEDFTLAELKTLRAVERIPELRQESTVFDGRYEVPTLTEVIRLRRDLSQELGREICVYIETKHPTYFDSIGLSLEEPLVREINRGGLNVRGGAAYLQSFELTNLIELDNDLKVRVPLVFLASTGAPYDLVAAGDPRTYADLLQPESLQELSADIDGIGPSKTLVIPRAADGTLGEPTSLVDDAHTAGLFVHPYTFRAENTFLPSDYRSTADPADFGRMIEEIDAYLAVGVDGFFTDQPDLGVVAVQEFLADR